MFIPRIAIAIAMGISINTGVSGLGQAAGDALSFMTVGSSTSAPVGHVDFCKRFGSECRPTARQPQLMQLTRARWDELLSINARINQSVKPVTDQDLYSQAEVWTYPTNAGDCEDYVLLKRRTLIERGWPAGALLITVVRDNTGGGHAVLTVRTDRGDLILDNQIEAVLPWYRTPYRYIKRQSETDAAQWRAISDQRVGAVASIGG